MPPIKLNPSNVKALASQKKEYAVYDTDVPGFLVKVTPRGKKVFYLWYRTREGRAGKYRLGDFPTMTPHEAREAARRQALAIAGGADPARALAENKAAPTVDELCTRFKEWLAAHRKPSTVKEYGRVIDRHIEPKWGNAKVHALTQAEVEAAHAKRSSTPYEANRILAVLSSMLGKAIDWKLLPKGSNFCEDIERFPEFRRGTILNSEQMKSLGEALRALQAQDTTRQVANALFLLLFTGCRKGEIVTLKWDFIDLEHAVIRFPDSKNGQRTHVLGHAGVTLLSGIARTQGTPYVFPSPGDITKPLSASTLSHVWDRVRKATGLEGVRIHDLRHNRGSWGAKNQLGGFTLQQMLGHKNMVTTQRYLHAFDDALLAANNKIDGQFAELLGVGGAEVIPFPNSQEKGAA